MAPKTSQRGVCGLLEPLSDLREELAAAAEPLANATLSPAARRSAENLSHYLALRSRDIRPLQQRLAREGLSSLGRSEGWVLSNVDAVLGDVERLAGHRPTVRPETGVSLDEAEALLADRTAQLLGPVPEARRVRIMVTLPSEAATDPGLTHAMVAAGMDCARINCAHDSPGDWAAMAANVREAAGALGRSCQVAMDIPGPKLRTGGVRDHPGVARIRRSRSGGSGVARGRLVAESGAPAGEHASIPVPSEWLAGLQVGDEVVVTDVRKGDRLLIVSDVHEGWCSVVAPKPCRVASGARVLRVRDSTRAQVGELPPLPGDIALRAGDVLHLTRDQAPGCPANGAWPATVPCTLPEVFTSVRAGEPIWIDDGRIGGVIERVSPDVVSARVTHAPPGGARLRAEKGLNLPETQLPAIVGQSADDRLALAAAAELADLVGLSFVSQPSEVADISTRIQELAPERTVGIVLKIETKRAFSRLPDLLHAALRSELPFGVMIARGDLAIECGWERLAEVQEEILWVCEAAHTPVIWATQVLESLAKSGLPSRAEITDAAMSSRAECVMLNKGPMINEAIATLDDILRRMQAHQRKKRSLLRPLSAWTPRKSS
jgi:pyruvate kinase